METTNDTQQLGVCAEVNIILTPDQILIVLERDTMPTLSLF